MRWRMLALLFAARAALGLQFQTMASVGDDLAAVYGLSHAEIGTLIGLFMAPGLFLAMPAGFTGRWASDRTLAALGLAALTFGGILSGTADSTWIIGAGRIVAGAGFLFANLYFTKMVTDWFSGREIATAMSVLVMSWPLGIAIGQIGHEWLAASMGWRVPFLVSSAYCAAMMLGVLMLYRPIEETAGTGAPAPAGQRTTVRRLSRTEWRLVLTAGIAWAVFNAGYVIYLSHGPLMLQQLGTTAFGAAAVISVASWLMIFSGALCGHIADRTGRRSLILSICMAGAVLSLLMLTVPGAGLAGSLLFGLVGMAPAGVIMALAGEAMRTEVRALGMGIFFTVYYAVMTVAPPIAGRLFDQTGTAVAPIILAAVLFAAVVPASMIFRHIRADREPGTAQAAQPAPKVHRRK